MGELKWSRMGEKPILSLCVQCVKFGCEKPFEAETPPAQRNVGLFLGGAVALCGLCSGFPAAPEKSEVLVYPGCTRPLAKREKLLRMDE